MKKIRKYKIKDLKVPSSLKKDYQQAMNQGESHASYKYWSTLTESLKKGYNPKGNNNCYIRLSKKGHMIDGNHRATVLSDIYGGEKEIDVELISIPYHILLVLISIFILFPIHYIKGLITGKGKPREKCCQQIPAPTPLQIEIGIKYKGKHYSILSIIWTIIKTIFLIPIALLVFILGKIGTVLGIENKRVRAYKKLKGLK
jgi:hypothetical protein